METKYFSSQRRRIFVEGLLVRIQEDGCIILTGGDEPHIGAVSIGKADAFQQTVSFIHHKEDKIVSDIANQLLRSDILRHFVLCCGIHVDNITVQEISDVLEMCSEIFNDMQSFIVGDMPKK